MTEIEKNLLREIADLHKVPEGAYNIREDGKVGLCFRFYYSIKITQNSVFREQT